MKTNIKKKSELAIDKTEAELRLQVREFIRDGESALPFEAELAKQYGVSRNTMRAALGRLKKERIIRSVPGKGNFIVPEEKRPHLALVLCYDIGSAQSEFAMMAVNSIMSEMRERKIPVMMGLMNEHDKDWSHLGIDINDVRMVFVLGGAREYWKKIFKGTQVAVIVLNDFHETVRERPFCTQVIADTRAAAFLATKYQLKKGHKRIMFLTWDKEEVWVRDALRGYKEALEAVGLPYDDNLVLSLSTETVDFDVTHDDVVNAHQSFQSRIDALLEGDNPPTAVVCQGVGGQLYELNQVYFHGRFSAENAVSFCFEELLNTDFKGSEEAFAVAMPFKSLVSQALDLQNMVQTSEVEPMCLVSDQHKLYCRKNGEWTEVKEQ